MRLVTKARLLHLVDLVHIARSGGRQERQGLAAIFCAIEHAEPSGTRLATGDHIPSSAGDTDSLLGENHPNNWQRRIAPMMRMERRQTPRMPVEGLAYVNLEPDNGGIVLNISEGGLCFHSTASVQQTTTIRFWFSQHNSQDEADDRLAWTDETQKRGGSRSIEADSELAWTDKTRKIGGLRFTHLPAGAREEIRDWISQHTAPVTVDEKSAPSLPSSRRSPSLSANGPDTTAARRSSTTLEVLSPDIQPPRRLTGFSGGLLAGVLVSVFGGPTVVKSIISSFIWANDWGETPRCSRRRQNRSPPRTNHSRYRLLR